MPPYRTMRKKAAGPLVPSRRGVPREPLGSAGPRSFPSYPPPSLLLPPSLDLFVPMPPALSALLALQPLSHLIPSLAKEAVGPSDDVRRFELRAKRGLEIKRCMRYFTLGSTCQDHELLACLLTITTHSPKYTAHRKSG